MLTGKEAYTFVAAFEDVESSVLYQEKFTENLAPEGTEIDFLRGDDHGLFWNAFNATYPHIHQGNEGMVLKFGSKNMDVLKLVLASEKAAVNSGVEILAHGGLGHGIGQFIVNGESQKVRVAAAELRKEAVSLGGYAVVKQAAYKERLQFNPWGETPAYHFLLQGIKDKIDPNRVLNDKRFVGGIKMNAKTSELPCSQGLGNYLWSDPPDENKWADCVHCGMCLESCPTYEITGQEQHSPRGRVHLIKSVAEGKLEVNEQFMDPVFACLDCRACTTACPADVDVGGLIRGSARESPPGNAADRLERGGQ